MDIVHYTSKALTPEQAMEAKKVAHRVVTLRYYYANKDKFRRYARARRRNPKRKLAETTMARIRHWLRSEKFLAGKLPSSAKRRKRTSIDRVLGTPMPRKLPLPLKELLGCTGAEFKAHIESQFTEEMTWANRGWLWQLGHRLPVRFFDCSNPKQLRACFHYKNLQPELEHENMSRKNEQWVP
jgi:hypothetical protein